MKFLTLTYLFGAPLLFTSLSLILSAVLLFNNPSRKDRLYLLEFDISQADFNQIYSFNPPLSSSLSYNDTDFTADVFRFGLWGYCNGSRSVNSAGLVNTNSFNGLGCSSRNERYTPDVQVILLSGASSQSETVTLNMQGLSRVSGRSTRIFNSIMAGFCVSVLTTVAIFISYPVVYYFPVTSVYAYATSIVFSFVEWICLVIGMASAKTLYEDLSDYYTSSTWKTVATKGTEWFNIGWATLAFSILTFISLIAALSLQIFLDKKEAKRELQLQQQQYDQGFGQPIPEFNKETEIESGINSNSGAQSTAIPDQYATYPAENFVPVVEEK